MLPGQPTPTSSTREPARRIGASVPLMPAAGVILTSCHCLSLLKIGPGDSVTRFYVYVQLCNGVTVRRHPRRRTPVFMLARICGPVKQSPCGLCPFVPCPFAPATTAARDTIQTPAHTTRTTTRTARYTGHPATSYAFVGVRRESSSPLRCGFLLLYGSAMPVYRCNGLALDAGQIASVTGCSGFGTPNSTVYRTGHTNSLAKTRVFVVARIRRFRYAWDSVFGSVERGNE